ncbi:hypothetical protein H4R19_006360, partial [Coemansia spiralis]
LRLLLAARTLRRRPRKTSTLMRPLSTLSKSQTRLGVATLLPSMIHRRMTTRRPA